MKDCINEEEAQLALDAFPGISFLKQAHSVVDLSDGNLKPETEFNHQLDILFSSSGDIQVVASTPSKNGDLDVHLFNLNILAFFTRNLICFTETPPSARPLPWVDSEAANICIQLNPVESHTTLDSAGFSLVVSEISMSRERKSFRNTYYTRRGSPYPCHNFKAKGFGLLARGINLYFHVAMLALLERYDDYEHSNAWRIIAYSAMTLLTKWAVRGDIKMSNFLTISNMAYMAVLENIATLEPRTN